MAELSTYRRVTLFRRTVLAGCAIVCFACGYDDHGPAVVETDPPAATLPISELHRYYEMGGVTTFVLENTVSGVVTASDASGNFYRTFVIDDGTGGLEIKAGQYDLHVLYPVGRRVSVHLTGLTLGYYSGIHQLGFYALPSSGYEVEYFQHSAVMDRYVSRGGMEPVVPETVTLSGMNDVLTGRLVKIEDVVCLREDTVTWVIGGYPTDIPFGSDLGSEDYFTVYTSNYADFASASVPAGRVNLTGVLMKNNNRYRLKMRNLDDVEILEN